MRTYRFAVLCLLRTLLLVGLTGADGQASLRAESNGSEGLVLGNTAKKLSGQEFAWSAYVMGPDEVLNKIKCVEFVLHPTFPKPVQSVCSRGNVPGKGFFLNATGWGTFKLGATVTLKTGKSFYLTHYLHFSVDAEGAGYLPGGFRDQDVTIPVVASTTQEGNFRFTLAVRRRSNGVEISVTKIELRNGGSVSQKWGFTVTANGEELIDIPPRSYSSLRKTGAITLRAAGTLPDVKGSMIIVVQGRH